MTVVHLYAGTNDLGTRVLDEVEVDVLGDNRFRIARSPGLVLGLARGDVIRIEADFRFEIIRRGGNVAVQVHAPPELESGVRGELAERLAAIGGSLDEYLEHRIAVFSVPLSDGFERIEAIAGEFVRIHPECDWYYGNVYDTDNVTPLRWWEPLA